MKKRSLILLLMLLWGVAACSSTPAEDPLAVAEEPGVVTVFKSPTWGCCGDWSAHLEEHGFTVVEKGVQNLVEVKDRYQVPTSLYSCHTAVVDGYIVEGHVPAAEVSRLLTEKPDVVGIGVPGMPAGSPGMESPGVAPESFDVFTFNEMGETAVYASYP